MDDHLFLGLRARKHAQFENKSATKPNADVNPSENAVGRQCDSTFLDLLRSAPKTCCALCEARRTLDPILSRLSHPQMTSSTLIQQYSANAGQREARGFKSVTVCEGGRCVCA